MIKQRSSMTALPLATAEQPPACAAAQEACAKEACPVCLKVFTSHAFLAAHIVLLKKAGARWLSSGAAALCTSADSYRAPLTPPPPPAPLMPPPLLAVVVASLLPLLPLPPLALLLLPPLPPALLGTQHALLLLPLLLIQQQ